MTVPRPLHLQSFKLLYCRPRLQSSHASGAIELPSECCGEQDAAFLMNFKPTHCRPVDQDQGANRRYVPLTPTRMSYTDCKMTLRSGSSPVMHRYSCTSKVKTWKAAEYASMRSMLEAPI